MGYYFVISQPMHLPIVHVATYLKNATCNTTSKIMYLQKNVIPLKICHGKTCFLGPGHKVCVLGGGGGGRYSKILP